jgi:NTE family protein
MKPRYLLAACLALPLLIGCARSNRYDSLKAVSLEQLRMTPPSRESSQKPRIGFAFGGGGVRGFVHLGVLRVLDEAGIRAEIVTGSSIGAAAAALYASGLTATAIEEKIRALGNHELADPVPSQRGFLNGQAFARWINANIDHRPMNALPLPLGIAVTDLDKGRALVVVDGDVGQAEQASASEPGTVIPVESGGTTYIDGGVLTLVPVRAAWALGADIVIGVDIYCGTETLPKGHALDTMLRTFRLQSCTLSASEMTESDVLIRPRFKPDNPISFAQRDTAIQAGYEAAIAAFPAIRRKRDAMSISY